MSLFKIKSIVLCSAILSAMWLVSCKTTPTPSQPEAQAPDTQKPTETGQSTSSESTQSAQPAAAQKSRTDQKVSSGAPEPESTETMEKPRTEQTVSPAESGSKEADQHLAESRTKAALSAKSRLEKARDDLRVSQATEKRIAAELEQLKRSENASAEDIRNYETYLQRVQAMVAENRQTVAKMEAAYNEHSPSKESSETSAPNDLEKLANPPIPEENAPDQVAELDRQLNASLSEFDAVLLKKMETIETESAAKMNDLAHQAAEAAKRLKKEGEADKSEPSEEGSNLGGQSSKGEPGEQGGKGSAGAQKSPQTEQDQGDETVATGDRSTGGGSGPQHPGSRYSKEDDDIVARQLREAAEKETDPELKEKLWKEYEAYRKNTQP